MTHSFGHIHGQKLSGPGCDTVQKMIVGSGIDMIEIARIAETLERYGDRFRRRIYLPGEIAYCLRKRNAAESFAARFAAKEAAAKALGTGIQSGVGWREIEVLRAPSGRPTLAFHGRAAEVFQRLGARHAVVSLTHTGTHALAQVLLET
jgi:holo-[acyl-carrier protein] synthase